LTLVYNSEEYGTVTGSNRRGRPALGTTAVRRDMVSFIRITGPRSFSR